MHFREDILYLINKMHFNKQDLPLLSNIAYVRAGSDSKSDIF